MPHVSERLQLILESGAAVVVVVAVECTGGHGSVHVLVAVNLQLLLLRAGSVRRERERGLSPDGHHVML